MTAVANKLNLEYDQVKNWFSNRRFKWNNKTNDTSKIARKRKPYKKRGENPEESNKEFKPRISINSKLLTRSLRSGM